ncbi:hypothetical protein H9Y04_17450 [Streptomyces sp. TRM66268-LWL]|uniref:Phage or prophage related protein n=1 Tax=Streptomyces polyasparticus TaxID=2767826 RepID=A0ABR7SGK9_9ACTN|nr:hypothetical protein [Streptomyces polyasparticus]MBC9714349.1 hypothetical protein [Streptomyces polyasparticus]
MARIRTIKPEAFISESLAAVSVPAERTFFGLLTQADDHGRFRDQAAVIAGALWSLRPEHGALEVEDDLNQLDGAGLICRYEGEDGRRYLHIVTWSRHQKINRPSGSRCPACPRHEGGRSAGPAERAHGIGMSVQEEFSEDSGHRREPSLNERTAGQGGFSEASPQAQEYAVKVHVPDLGPRTMDLGSTPLGGASAHAPDTVSAGELIGEYVAACVHRPPRDFLGHLGREVNKLLGEGIDVAHLRAGLDLHRAKGLSPSTLPSVVHEAMNATRKINRGSGSTVLVPSPHTPWRNPIDPAAYEEEL